MKMYVIASILTITLAGCSGKSKEPLYLDANQPVEKRVNDLLGRMTLQEKVAQMSQYVGIEHMKVAEKEMTLEEMKKSHAQGFYPNLHSSELIEMTKSGLIGSFLHVTTTKEANLLQSYAAESRLKIPVLIGIDAIHGTGLYRGATIYPTPIGQAATFEPALIEKASRETALEMRATGTHWTFTPNVEVARDARWGRVGETFGEDPLLVGQMGAATVRGLQTADFTGQDKVIACAKHFIGGSQPINGINGAPCDVSDRTLHEVFMPPFKDCLDAGVFTFMMAHNEVNGVPCHVSKYLMTDVLRNRWNFDGIIVSDWMDLEQVHEKHRTAPTLKDAFVQSVNYGMDMHMHGPYFTDMIVEAVNEGLIPQKRIDDAIRAILTAKFKLGLFENPYIDEEQLTAVLFNAEHRHTALEIARKSITLLKNENNLLPIDRSKYKKIFVTGPNADNQTILGDWAFQQPDSCVTTVIEGLRNVSPQTEFNFFPFGTNLRTMEMSRVLQAKEQARKADLAIVVVGENSMRYMWQDKTCGENVDRYELSLVGLQQQLVEEIYATGVPTIVVLVNGRPLTTEWIADHIPALIEAWEPGSFGGQAIAEVLFGDVNPEGKLPMTIPRDAGQIQTYYNYKQTSKWFKYGTGKSTPLFEFGYGLNYSFFEFSPVKLSAAKMPVDGILTASVEVTNTSQVAGAEVVQMYIKDCYSSVVRPVKELKGYKKVFLNPGEKATVTFEITPKELSFYDIDMKYGVEKGEFEIMIGNSSRDVDLQKEMFEVI
ncbi:glycoside hydrolase family 3 N-terminal domain-containing protein [Bacteroides sp. 51]|uniref:glycoside hydrolase family 3 N-terminal domain-containing protein n=1 Tax=Bacteroides sp. 51 TaxID=2302938 RepID=UPI0019402E2B|nr:glycoside hydrolase family 3 N-terminal domain-containing protein [Bacteroides sp. 51]